MNKAEQWLKNEIDKLDYTLSDIKDTWFTVKYSDNEEDTVEVHFENLYFVFNSCCINDYYCIDFNISKQLIQIAEEYKRKVAEDE